MCRLPRKSLSFFTLGFKNERVSISHFVIFARLCFAGMTSAVIITKTSLAEDTCVDSSIVSTTVVAVGGNASPPKCTPPVISNLVCKEDYDSSATVSITRY